MGVDPSHVLGHAKESAAPVQLYVLKYNFDEMLFISGGPVTEEVASCKVWGIVDCYL